ncbi:leucine-rich repeat, immunoglobulin-like domain and transmembrane domain-containing protein 3a [Nothobranchius furzeri]|uniref:Ig-like and transmembrane domains 3 n=1 Tax=Nothobranchius furzeri TaxID=105023 RepID=A0A8C6NLG1_NOTFU|nr:leucine-rich repeat, immunoglobulin-like domain and transmembrane domain-containing protein 3a [Nothobranchius furzeri]XP_054595254.1 leucine-rich repeat, immunoglobulin-like domain and transmembrane domain-containing protein 3a [Nothobranchius furzeri]KAF7228594.1 Ig-like and transmembrane domains 3 [Nothobranchius furzeri]
MSFLGASVDIMHQLLCLHVFLCCFGTAVAFCPSQCTCVFHGRTDGPGTRSVLCNDPDMSDIPVNVPVDTIKLRVEKTAVRRIPTEAFYYLVELRYLWITYNSVTSVDTGSFYNLKVLHELRLDGNMISVFPWESLKEMPRLRTLDLHNNRLTNVPIEAIPHLLNITYLDLSSNKLTTLPSDLMDIWPPFNGVPTTSNASQKVVLGLQDNPWFCNCKISKLIEMSKMADTPVVLMDLFLTCAAPENLSGVLFQRAELENCVKPSVMTSATKITSALGSNVLLRCDATGAPTPVLYWAKSDGSPVNNTIQESPGEGIKWSIMSLHGIEFKDAGDYSCKAKNDAGTAKATISLSVAGTIITTAPPIRFGGGTRPTPDTTLTSPSDISNTPFIMTTVLPRFSTVSAVQKPPNSASGSDLQKGSLKLIKNQQGSNGKKLAADEKSRKSDASQSINNLQIIEETADSAVLLWTAGGLLNDAPLTVVYSPYGEQDDTKRTVETKAGRGKVLLDGLSPGMRYSVCLVAKGSSAGKDPCIDFYTEDSGQNQLFLIVSGIACALALPLIALLVYKIIALYCKGQNSALDEQELEKESYVKFETITMKQRTLNPNPTELWARRPTNESERLLLCSRSSIDSQMTYKSDSSRSEYLC